MTKLIKLIGSACVLCCAALAFTALSSNAQLGKPISDAQAATLRGGCDTYSWQGCTGENGCSGNIYGFRQSGGTETGNGHLIYCCSSGAGSCSNCGKPCE